MNLKNLVVIGVVIAGIFVALKLFRGTDVNAFHNMAKERVETIFVNLQDGADQQKAIGFWRKGGNEPATEGALDSFEKWLAKKNLKMKIESYNYVSSDVVDGEDVLNRYVIVNFRVDGRPFSVQVRQGSPVEWADE